jgi:hypothetical protein
MMVFVSNLIHVPEIIIEGYCPRLITLALLFDDICMEV